MPKKIKSLLAFSNRINSEAVDNEKITQAADNFIKGDDKMKFHRQMFVATRLLETNKNVLKAKEIVQSAIPLLDSSLDVKNPAAAVLADELFAPRQTAIENGELIIIPDVPKETLQTVLRGRIEELTGWAEQSEANPELALVHYKRGLSILPKDSAMWHSTMWRMGETLQTQGKSKEALDSYVQSYQDTAPNAVRYLVIETLYKQINGTTDGLEKKVGKKPATFDNISAIANLPTVKNTTAEPENTVVTDDSVTEPEIQKDESVIVPVETPTTVEPQTETETLTETVDNNPTEIQKPETPTENLPITEAEDKTETPIADNDANDESVADEKLTTKKDKQNSDDESVADDKPEIEENKQNSDSPVESEIEIVDTPKPQETIKPTATESPKSLFEPIIIGIPKTEKTKPVKTDVPETADKAQSKEETTEKPIENLEKPIENSKDGQSRPRVITEDKIKETTVESCKIVVTQENVSLISDGGNLGLLIALEGAPENAEIKAVSSSPRDVQVVLEPGIGSSSSNRSFFYNQFNQQKQRTFYRYFYNRLRRKRNLR